MLAHNRPTATPGLVVHETARPPAPFLRYIDQVTGGPGTDVEFRYSQGVLTNFDIDVVHVAEPNLDLLLGTRGATSLQRVAATLALTRNLRRHRIALVRTLPGVGDGSKTGRLPGPAARILDRATATFVVFDDSTPTPDPARTTVIPHAHFRDRYVGYPAASQVRGRVLFAGSGELPAQVRGLLALPRLTTVDVTLRLAGVAGSELEEAIRSTLARHPGTLSVRLERLSDSAQVLEIDSSELVAVPRVQSLVELQLVFLALSRDRAVLTPRTNTMIRLAETVGPGWVHLSDGPLTAESVDAAFDSLRSPSRARLPDLSGRDLSTTHAAYESAYRAAASQLSRASRNFSSARAGKRCRP